MVVSQAIQVVFFTAGLFAFFLALGIIAIPDDVTVLWSAEETCPVGQPPCAGTWFGVHIPIPQTVVHTSLFVAVLSGLYFTVSTSVDPLYRQRFFDPLVSDVATSLAGRDAYLEMENTPRHTRPRGLEVLTQVGFGVDGPAGTRRLARDQRADVDDPLALLARDPCPVIGIGGVGQVLVLGELVDDRVEQMLDAQTLLARSPAPT